MSVPNVLAPFLRYGEIVAENRGFYHAVFDDRLGTTSFELGLYIKIVNVRKKESLGYHMALFPLSYVQPFW